MAPSFVSRSMGISLVDAQDLLYRAYEVGILRPRFEIVCPTCDKTFRTVENIAQIPSCEASCEDCGDVFAPSARDVWLSYTLVCLPDDPASEVCATSDGGTQSGDSASDNMASVWADPYKFLDQLYRPDLSKLTKYVSQLDSAATNDEKKKSLEGLASVIVDGVIGFSLINHNMRTPDSEIDLLYRNMAVHPFLHGLGSPFTVECKNHSTKATAAEIRVANDNAREYRAKLCLFFSPAGVTGRQMTDGWLRVQETFRDEGRFIPVFQREDYDALLAGENFIHQLIEETERIQMRQPRKYQ